MVSPKQLAQLAKKWQYLRGKADSNSQGRSIVLKGHCVIYSAYGRRFEAPLVYLSTLILRELLRMSQEELGFTSDGKIRLPCARVMEYVTYLLRRNASAEVESVLLSSMVGGCTMPTIGASKQI